MKALEDVDILVEWGDIHVDVGTHDIFLDNDIFVNALTNVQC